MSRPARIKKKRARMTPRSHQDKKRPPNKWRGFLRLLNGLKGYRVPNDISKQETEAMISEVCGEWAPAATEISGCRNHFHAFARFLTRYTGREVTEGMARMCFSHCMRGGYSYTPYFFEAVLGPRAWPPARSPSTANQCATRPASESTKEALQDSGPRSPKANVNTNVNTKTKTLLSPVVASPTGRYAPLPPWTEIEPLMLSFWDATNFDQRLV